MLKMPTVPRPTVYDVSPLAAMIGTLSSTSSLKADRSGHVDQDAPSQRRSNGSSSENR